VPIEPDLATAPSAVDAAKTVVDAGFRHLAANGDVETDQVAAYDLAHSAAAVENARASLDYGAKGDVEARIALRELEQRERPMTSRRCRGPLRQYRTEEVPTDEAQSDR
jgi:hypothetical protein